MTTISVNIVIMAGLAMSVGLGTAFAGISDAPTPSNTEGASQSITALDENECRAIWSETADRLSYDKAAPFINDIQAADPDNDGYFDESEFIAACQKGLVQSVFQDTNTRKSSHTMLRKR